MHCTLNKNHLYFLCSWISNINLHDLPSQIFWSVFLPYVPRPFSQRYEELMLVLLPKLHKINAGMVKRSRTVNAWGTMWTANAGSFWLLLVILPRGRGSIMTIMGTSMNILLITSSKLSPKMGLTLLIMDYNIFHSTIQIFRIFRALENSNNFVYPLKL